MLVKKKIHMFTCSVSNLFKVVPVSWCLTCLRLHNHVTFRIFFTLCSTCSLHFKLFRFLKARKSVNQITSCCFNFVLPKKKNLLLWIHFNSWKTQAIHFKTQMFPTMSTSHKSPKCTDNHMFVKLLL